MAAKQTTKRKTTTRRATSSRSNTSTKQTRSTDHGFYILLTILLSIGLLVIALLRDDLSTYITMAYLLFMVWSAYILRVI